MQLSFDDAGRLVVQVLSRHGMAEDHARIVGDHLIDAAISGHAFAGLPRVLAIVENLRARPAARPIRIESRSESSIVVHGGGNNGYVTTLKGLEAGMDLARERGVAVVGINETWFSGRLAYYVERAASAGFVAMHTANTSARVAPYGGIDRLFGTNPVAFGFPADPEPLVVDFGTGMTTWGETLLRQKLDRPLEAGSAVDADGQPTNDPTAALAGAFLPWGGHRGYGLSLVVQALGILCGSAVVVDDVAECGFFFLIIDPEVLMPRDTFASRIGDLVARIEGSRPALGQERVRVPGRTSLAQRAEGRAAGTVEVDEEIYRALVALRDGAA